MTSSWFFLSTPNYDARSTTHQIGSYIWHAVIYGGGVFGWGYEISCVFIGRGGEYMGTVVLNYVLYSLDV